MDAPLAAAHNGSRILILGSDLAVIEPAVALLEDWGTQPLVLFDVPSAMNALVRTRPYLVVLDSRFGADLTGLLSVLQGDRVLPVDARRPVPTLVLTGPDTPPLETLLGPTLGTDAIRHVRTVPRDQPLAVAAALREALRAAGLSSYAPLAFGPPNPPAVTASRTVPILPERTAVLSTTARDGVPPDRRGRRVTQALLALALLALLTLFAIPTYLLTNHPSAPRPSAQPILASPSAGDSRSPQPGAASQSGTPATQPDPFNQTPPGAQTTPVTPGSTSTSAPASSGAPASTGTQPEISAARVSGSPGIQPTPITGAAAGTGSPLDPLRGLLGPLLGPPPAPGAPAVRSPWQPPLAQRLSFCGDVERWRPLVRETLAEAWTESRLDGPAFALDDDLVLALILRESTGDPRAIGTGGDGEIGLLQLLPTTFAEQLARPKTEPITTLVQAMQDPRANLRAGVRYLSRAFSAQGGDIYWSLVAYRAGIEGASNWRRAGGTSSEIDARVRATLETYARHRPDVRLVFVPSPGAPAPATIRPLMPAGSC